jgi:hypothetical protein
MIGLVKEVRGYQYEHSFYEEGRVEENCRRTWPPEAADSLRNSVVRIHFLRQN